MKRFIYPILLMVVLMLSACSTSTEDLSDGISKDLEKKATEFRDTAIEETKSKVDQTLNEGIDKVGGLLNGILDSSTRDATSVEKKPEQSIDTGGTTERIPVRLQRVVDGDTILISYQETEQKVRYLLTDTPESVHPNKEVDSFGKEASARNAELLASGDVSIEFDVGECIDKYGRLLAYVYVDGLSVSEQLIREGLAQVAYVYPTNTRHLDAYKKAEVSAKKEKLGVWSNSYE